ncbi:DinB family protein [Pseudozobellia thermophila]|uniref:DinB superfamily protein n=1 Tax=Pseudozobellia thermophila TaxID=192903 RepID=A0A1M6L5R2_9FLAO|nr:DinB family protein [Pseudozobellia thermophila]SHJ66389.1 DinB superfamily protein [Pseudozobellia thermophila]
MTTTARELLQDLLEMTRKNMNDVERFKSRSPEFLNWKENPNSWSVLECIEHLNRYGDFYIPEITKRIEASKHKNSELFKSNWLGEYFSRSVAYHNDLNKMKTFKSMNPINSTLTVQTLEKFIGQQHRIIELLDRSKSVNLDKTKTAISISKWVKLKLGDTLRVVVYHNERHVKQAEKTLKRALE